MVAEAGLEPTTSGLWAAVRAENPCYPVLFSPFESTFPQKPKVINPFGAAVSIVFYPRMGQNMGQAQSTIYYRYYRQSAGYSTDIQQLIRQGNKLKPSSYST